jgi:hypothetical protein
MRCGEPLSSGEPRARLGERRLRLSRIESKHFVIDARRERRPGEERDRIAMIAHVPDERRTGGDRRRSRMQSGSAGRG